MRCVPEAVNELFPELDLSKYPARNCGYGIGELQKMLPEEYIIEPLYVNFERALGRDLRRVITENKAVKIPLFFMSKTHCTLEWYYPNANKIGDIEADAFLNIESIYKICCILRYNDRRIMAMK